MRNRFFFRFYNFPSRDKSVADDKDRNDSIWAIIASVAKSYNLTFDYVLDNMTMANMTMYSAVLPNYSYNGNKSSKSDENEDIINADDPKNKEMVNKILNS